MATATLTFDLNDSDDVLAHLRAVKSLDMAMALWEIIHNTKKGLEWSMEEKEMDKYDALEMVYEKIHEILGEHNIKPDELIN
jgi:molecular chaperone GrpE (heat shock protein)